MTGDKQSDFRDCGEPCNGRGRWPDRGDAHPHSRRVSGRWNVPCGPSDRHARRQRTTRRTSARATGSALATHGNAAVAGSSWDVSDMTFPKTRQVVVVDFPEDFVAVDAHGAPKSWLPWGSLPGAKGLKGLDAFAIRGWVTSGRLRTPAEGLTYDVRSR